MFVCHSLRYAGANENFVPVVSPSPFDSIARRHSDFWLLTPSTPISRRDIKGAALGWFAWAQARVFRRRLQYKYTGIPVSRINQPLTEFPGSAHTVLATIATHATTNSAVV